MFYIIKYARQTGVVQSVTAENTKASAEYHHTGLRVHYIHTEPNKNPSPHGGSVHPRGR